MIYGNKEGIRDSLLAQLETLYDLEIPAEVFAPAELLDVLAAFTCAINREISMYISRSGEVLDITIGGTGSVELKDIHLRRNTRRLSMVRCIHTHPGGNPQLSDVDLSSLRAMHFDAMAAVGAKDGHATGIQAAFLGEYVGGVNRIHLTDITPFDWCAKQHAGRNGTCIFGRLGQRRIAQRACAACGNSWCACRRNDAPEKNATGHGDLYWKRQSGRAFACCAGERSGCRHF